MRACSTARWTWWPPTTRPTLPKKNRAACAKASWGWWGLETAFPVLYTHLVKTGTMTLEALLDRMRDKPAARFGFDDKNDWTAFDLDSACTIDPQTFLSPGPRHAFCRHARLWRMPFDDRRRENRMATPYDRKTSTRDGEEFYGRGFGDARESVGEVVFDTTMVGYQEIVSDPAYAFQIVVMTYPVIGNYGISDDDFESRAAAGRRPRGARLQRPALQLPLYAARWRRCWKTATSPASAKWTRAASPASSAMAAAAARC